MFSRMHFVLYANLLLFFYTLIDFNHKLFQTDNIFSQVASGGGRTLSDVMNSLPAGIGQWQIAIYIVIVALLVLVALRFFSLAFILMEIATLLTLINYAIQWFQSQQYMNSLFEAAVLLVSLASIWAVAHSLHMVK